MARFAQILASLGGGSVSKALDDQLTELVEAVRANNKVGTLTLKLKVMPNGENGITVEEDVAVKLPQPSRGKTLFFTDNYGNLSRSDPRQGEMFQPKPVAEETAKETA